MGTWNSVSGYMIGSHFCLRLWKKWFNVPRIWGTLNRLTFCYKLQDGCTLTKLQPSRFCKPLGSISQHSCTKFQAFECKQFLSIKENVKSGSTCPAFPYIIVVDFREVYAGRLEAYMVCLIQWQYICLVQKSKWQISERPSQSQGKHKDSPWIFIAFRSIDSYRIATWPTWLIVLFWS